MRPLDTNPGNNDEALMRAYQRLVTSNTDAATQVTAEELLSVVQRRGSESSRLAILDRVSTDANAQRDLALLRTAASLATVKRPAFSRIALAAAAVAVIAVGVAQFSFRRGEEDPYRGAASSAVLLVAPGDGAPVPDDQRFIWHAISGAVRYEVEVLDAGGAAVFKLSTLDTVAVVPRDVDLSTAALWTVTAVKPAGEVRSAPRNIRTQKDAR